MQGMIGIKNAVILFINNWNLTIHFRNSWRSVAFQLLICRCNLLELSSVYSLHILKLLFYLQSVIDCIGNYSINTPSKARPCRPSAAPAKDPNKRQCRSFSATQDPSAGETRFAKPFTCFLATGRRAPSEHLNNYYPAQFTKTIRKQLHAFSKSRSIIIFANTFMISKLF